MIKTPYILLVVVASLALVGGIGLWSEYRSGGAPELILGGNEKLEGPLSSEELKVSNPGITNDMNRLAIFTTNKGTFTIELFEDTMPITTGNFISLAEDGFYNGTKFHRVIDGFMIQGGDPNSKSDDVSSYGTGGPGYTIQDEFVKGDLLTNTRGTISMANTGQPNSGGSQFFINTEDNVGLDFDKEPLTSKHPVFGRVVSGMDVIDTISRVSTGAGDLPTDPVVIESVAIQEREGES